MPDRKRNVKTMYNITRPLELRVPSSSGGEKAAVGRREGRGGSTQFIKESTARNLRLLLTLGCRNLCELLTKEWRSFRSRTHYHEPTSRPSPSKGPHLPLGYGSLYTTP